MEDSYVLQMKNRKFPISIYVSAAMPNAVRFTASDRQSGPTIFCIILWKGKGNFW